VVITFLIYDNEGGAVLAEGTGSFIVKSIFFQLKLHETRDTVEVGRFREDAAEDAELLGILRFIGLLFFHEHVLTISVKISLSKLIGDVFCDGKDVNGWLIR